MFFILFSLMPFTFLISVYCRCNDMKVASIHHSNTPSRRRRRLRRRRYCRRHLCRRCYCRRHCFCRYFIQSTPLLTPPLSTPSPPLSTTLPPLLPIFSLCTIFLVDTSWPPPKSRRKQGVLTPSRSGRGDGSSSRLFQIRKMRRRLTSPLPDLEEAMVAQVASSRSGGGDNDACSSRFGTRQM